MKKNGFTLIEILIAMVIVATLSLVFFSNNKEKIQEGKIDGIAAEVSAKKSSIGNYIKTSDTGDFTNMTVETLDTMSKLEGLAHGAYDGTANTVTCQKVDATGAKYTVKTLANLADEAGTAPADGAEVICLDFANIALTVNGNGSTYDIKSYKSDSTNPKIAKQLEFIVNNLRAKNTTPTDTTPGDGATTATYSY